MNLLVVGDVMLGRTVNDVLKHASPTYPWGDTLPLLQKADWRACNLECVISDRGAPWQTPPKVFHFRSDAKNVAVLKAAGIDAIAIANNHTLDYDYDALLNMLPILDAGGIRHAGAGLSFAEACRPAICETKGMRIGLIAFTDNEPDWEATEQKPGVFYVPIDPQDQRAEMLLQVIRQARATVDYLIVSAHWGPNWGYRPQPPHMPFGRALIDAGADLVFGHSCHVFQGIEIHQGRPILYSTGNFIDDYAVDEVERNDQSFVFTLEMEGNRLRRLRLYATVIREFQARQAEGKEAQDIVAKMKELCAELGTHSIWDGKAAWLEIELA